MIMKAPRRVRSPDRILGIDTDIDDARTAFRGNGERTEQVML
jgi:hypothetical protein